MHLSILLFSTILHFTTSEWIDPHSMDTNAKSKLPKQSRSLDSQNGLSIVKRECNSDVHLRRVVRLILNNAYLDHDVGYHEGYINIKLSSLEYQLLVNFSQSTESEEQIFSEVSSIFENAFQKPTIDRYHDLILSMQDKLYHVIFNPTSAALFSVCVALFMTYKLLRAKFTWRSIIKYFIILAYIIDFVVTYLHIIREEEIEGMVSIKTLGTTPPECDPEKMSWWTFLKTQFQSNFAENPCKAYYRATYQNWAYIIAPSKILTRQFKTLIVEPCGDIGEAFGKFGRGLFTTLPWGLNIVIFPIMLLTGCLIIFIVSLFITKSRFKISLFHLFTIELGSPETRTESIHGNNREQIGFRPRQRRIRNSREEVGLVTNHRALVEEVLNNNSSRGNSRLQEGEEDVELEKKLSSCHATPPILSDDNTDSPCTASIKTDDSDSSTESFEAV